RMTSMSLLVAIVLTTTSYLFVSSALDGLTSMISQQHAMIGQDSTAWNIFSSLPGIAALLIGGALSGAMQGSNADEAARILFLVGAAVMAFVALYAAWRDRKSVV